MTPSADEVAIASQVEGVMPALEKLGATASQAEVAAGLEFLPDGLHLNKRLNKDRMGNKTQYRG